MGTFFKYFGTLITILIAFSIVKESLRQYGVVKLPSSKLCIPKSYELMVNIPYLWFIDKDELDENPAGGLYEISAEEIGDSIDLYTNSHINQYNVDLKHDISGIIWAISQIGKPDGSALWAWNVNEYKKQPAVIYNKELNLYEIGDARFIDSWWSLAKSPPIQNSHMPNNWFVGSCIGDRPLNFRCDRSFTYKDLYFTYSLQAHDLHLIPEIETFLENKFKEWEANCKL